MLLDIVILPPNSLRKKIGARIKKEVGKLPNSFVVDNVKLIPHLSLWHLDTSRRELNSLAKDLREIATVQKPVKISSAGFHVGKRYKHLVNFEVKGTEVLEALRKRVFQKAYPHKVDIMPHFLPTFGKWTGQSLREAKKYGKPLRFSPHFTMGWLRNEDDASGIVQKMKNVRFNFLAKEMYICEINNWWQVRRIIRKISFHK